MKRHLIIITIAASLAFVGILLLTRQRSELSSSPVEKFSPGPPQVGTTAPPAPAPVNRSLADVPAGSIQFYNVGLKEVLSIYAALTGAELLVEPRARTLPATITFSNRQDLTRREAIRLLEEALREQAGIVVEHQDARHIAVRRDERVRATK